MDITLPIAVVVTIIGAIFASGITAGGLVSRFIARERCENIRRECTCDRVKQMDSFSQKIDRVHVRLDEILLLLGEKKK
jgi:hypothetical protein